MLGFLLFMIAVVFIIPLTMLIYGYIWKKRPPAKINSTHGYRTRRSMFNKRTWDFAHKLCSKVWIRFGWWTTVFTAIVVVPLLESCANVNRIGVFGGIAVLLQMIPFVATLPIIERALKREFGI